jgi:Domain of unknown function (DUF4430)
VEAIQGVRSDAEQNRWWYFEVNGYRSNVAAERYLVRHRDRVRWTYVAAAPKPASTNPSQAAKGCAIETSGR